jgi:hypothetical protein
MIISYVGCAYPQIKQHKDHIKLLRDKHDYYGEMKWSKVSKFNGEFFNDVIDYFFATDLQFRAIVIDKSKLKHEDFEQTHDDFYDKMYFQLLSKKLYPEHNYNIYIDIKDTYSYLKAKSLKTYLERDFHNINRLQVIRSYESELLQLSDVLMGAINYKLRGLNKVTAKNKIIERIERHCGASIIQRTGRKENKFNLFFIDLK